MDRRFQRRADTTRICASGTTWPTEERYTSLERARLTYALLASLPVHAWLLTLTFGGQGLWLPVFHLPWQDRRIEAPDIRVELTAPPVAEPLPQAPVEPPTAEPAHRRSARHARALLLARVYEVFPLLCPLCGAKMHIIAFITDGSTVRDVLAHLGEPTAPPRIAPARGPPLWEAADRVRAGA